MIKIFLLLEGREAPFALTEQAAAEEVRGLLPDIAGYVQTRAMGDAHFSGCAEFYFGTESGAGSLDPAALSSLFSGATRVAASVSGDHRVVMRLPQFFKGPNVKGVYPFRRRVDLAVADFQAYWWHTHGPIAALTEHALAYCQTHPMRSAYEHGEPVDVFVRRFVIELIELTSTQCIVIVGCVVKRTVQPFRHMSWCDQSNSAGLVESRN